MALAKADIVSHIKEYWTERNKDAATYENNPFLAMVPKSTNGGGDTCNIPVDLDDGAEGSPTFATALAIAKDAAAMSGKRFVFDWMEDYQLARVPNKLIREMRNVPEQALLKATEQNVKARKVLSRRIGRYLWRTGWGEKGRINQSAFNVKTITLENKEDARHFHIGDQLVFGPDLDTSALRDSGDFVSVTKIDVDAGVITTDAPTDLSTSITGIADDDYIFARGSRSASGSPTRLLPLGVPSYIPDSAPGGSDSFGSVNRSVWVSRLAGLRYPATGTASGAIEEIFLRALIHGANQEANFDKVFVSNDVYGDLMVALEGRKGFQPVNEKVGSVGFAGFSIQVGYGQGEVKVFPEPNMPAKRAYALNMASWKLITCGEMIQNDLQEGSARDVEDSSSLEWRYVFHGQLTCNKPGANMVIKFA